MKKFVIRFVACLCFAIILSTPNNPVNAVEEDGGSGLCNQGCLNRPSENRGDCIETYEQCGIRYVCEQNFWIKNCVYAL